MRYRCAAHGSLCQGCSIDSCASRASRMRWRRHCRTSQTTRGGKSTSGGCTSSPGMQTKLPWPHCCCGPWHETSIVVTHPDLVRQSTSSRAAVRRRVRSIGAQWELRRRFTLRTCMSACCLVPVVCCLVPVVCCIVPVACRIMHTVRCMLSVACCMLFPALPAGSRYSPARRRSACRTRSSSSCRRWAAR